MVNYKALYARMRGLGITQDDIAKELGISQASLNQKIHNVRPMKLEEAIKIAETLKIEPRFWMGYFFDKEESNGVPDKKPAPVPAALVDGVALTDEETEIVRCYRKLEQEERLIVAALVGLLGTVNLQSVGFYDLLCIGEEL